MKYTSIDIIYNPKSTGPSGEYAKTLKQQLLKTYPSIPVSIKKTKYAGHAKEIAYIAAKSSKNPLIISSSGDGGYCEVVNGAMKAQLEGAKPVCAILAAGNANDHSRTMHDRSLFESIVANKNKSIDLLKITYENNNQKEVSYAHSYIGLGLSPSVAVELNKTDLNAFKELWIVLKTLYKFRPFKISHNSKVITLDSIIFANIGVMAKVLTLSKDSKADDGLFEVVKFKHSSKYKLIKKLAKATVTGLKHTQQSKDYKFTVFKKMPAQLDGEVIFIDKNSTVRITSEQKMLKTIF